jgi:hypothetical protein
VALHVTAAESVKRVFYKVEEVPMRGVVMNELPELVTATELVWIGRHVPYVQKLHP